MDNLQTYSNLGDYINSNASSEDTMNIFYTYYSNEARLNNFL